MLADGVSHLNGHAGDWLVDYGDGSFGIVTQAIFATTYEILDERSKMAFHQIIQRVLLVGVRMQTLPAPPAAAATGAPRAL